ncbi:MAG TPA: hypothetical protein P5256_00875 [Beijerinckiaceae bacterium]|nr:hypothetical protein [Rhodoblastus sp.]MCB1533383.1 hypothetical protein [Rhodoblastus sp.]MCC2106104.1 hypothetical protein [Hyphomicrobiales bacterium]HRY01647.1 hypothetical protein [Beijerinckiaceae bacterium]
MTKRRLRKLVAIAITTTTIATTAPANAQVAVLDNSVLLKMTDTLSTVKSQLGQLQQIFGTVQKMQQAVGQFGPGSILGILQSLTGINLGQFKNVLNGIAPQLKTTGFASALQGNSSFTSALSSLQNAYSNSGNGIGSTKSTLMSALYAPAGSSVTQSQAEGLTAARAAATREAAANAMAAGLQARSTLVGQGQTDLNSLAASAKAAQDLRGDIAANNAIMLKVLEQLQQTNAQLGSLLHLQGAASIQNDSVQAQTTN